MASPVRTEVWTTVDATTVDTLPDVDSEGCGPVKMRYCLSSRASGMCIRAPPPVGDLQAQEQSGSGDVDSLWTDHSRSRCTTFCWRKVKKMVVGRVDVATPEGKPVPSSSGVESELAIAEDGVRGPVLFEARLFEGHRGHASADAGRLARGEESRGICLLSVFKCCCSCWRSEAAEPC